MPRDCKCQWEVGARGASVVATLCAYAAVIVYYFNIQHTASAAIYYFLCRVRQQLVLMDAMDAEYANPHLLSQ